MSGYERKSLQLLGGGFNMVPPVDKVPITDYLLAQNWRVDALGRLVSRAGYPSVLSIADAGLAHSAGSAGGVASPLYVGCNSGISNPTSAVYYDQNATAIATGFDGRRIGFASQNGFMWIMNRGKQGRHSVAAGFEAWNLTPPPASPTAAAGSSPSPTANATFTYNFQGESITASIAAGAQTVTPVSMGSIVEGTRLGFGTNSSDYEIVTVTGVTGTTFDAVFTFAHAGPSLAAYYDYVHSLTIAGVTYSFVQNGYSQAQIPQLIAGIAGVDPNCSVTYVGTGQDVVITPIPPNTLIALSGSDGNADANVANGAITSLPSGTYQFYLTFVSADLTLESNPSPASDAVTVTAQSIDVTIPAADAPVDARIGFVRIYATGGTLAQAYQVGQVASTAGSPATDFADTVPDLQATANGVVMPTDNDAPPAAAGIIGPHFSRLYAWSTAPHKNRLFWTDPNLPQYWPGAADEQEGNWVDVGDEGEEIVWCTIHTNLEVIYKERSIWMLIGSDPGTATLEKVYDGCGLAGQFGLAPAGMIDYFVGPNALYVFDMNAVHEVAGAVLPIFNQSITNAGALTSPGSVLAGSAFNSRSLAPYAVSLGHANGKLYVSYAELGGTYNTLVYNEGKQPETNAYVGAQPGRWFYHRNAIASIENGFFGFFFDGKHMLGLTGVIGGAAKGYDLDDFRGFLTEDPGSAAIECVYQSHYDDCGLPENPKVWLDLVVDIELAGDTATVYAGFSNGLTALASLGTVATSGRTQATFPLSAVGTLTKNISIAIDVPAAAAVIIHNVYIYFYVEERQALTAGTLPSDLGVGKVKECKEVELDINNPVGTASLRVASDLPGNAMGNHTPITIPQGTFRRILKFPFAVEQGLLWQVFVTAAGANLFQLYSVRLLMRVLAVYVEGYESTAGFVWDSMQQDCGDGDVKTFDQLRFDMEAGGASSVTMLTDLPGEAFATRGGGALALTSGSTSRAWVTVPLPDPYGDSAIEGRSIQLQVTGHTGFKLYKVQARYNRIGRYLMGTAPDAADDAFTTLEFDFSSERTKVYRRLEIDMRAEGTVNLSVITDQSGTLGTISGPTGLTTTGRKTVMVPMPPGVRGRLLRLFLSSTDPARIYRIRVWTRPLSEPSGAWKWEDFPLEASDVVPTWKDLIAEETTPVWQWVDIPFEVTNG
jgi:hypothetical protein